MALKATIFKVDLQLTDMDRHYYENHLLTIARHPSETDERMMVRLLAFALNASENLEFTKGLSADDEPSIWQKSLSNELEIWIDVGLPDEKNIRKASNRADQVMIYSYGGNAADIWWNQIQTKLTRFNNVTVINLPEADTQALAQLTTRTMQLNCTIQDGQVWISDDSHTQEITPILLK
ncbi:MAG: YaeQ family protein [Pseudomonadales bacterium]|nr:YaeQ family protein [Pseudomonadales bacterium]